MTASRILSFMKRLVFTTTFIGVFPDFSTIIDAMLASFGGSVYSVVSASASLACPLPFFSGFDLGGAG